MEIINRKEAEQQGLKRYFTGKPCKWGHISQRFLGGACEQCVRIQCKRWYVDHRDLVIQRAAGWSKANPVRCNASKRKWRLQYPEKQAASEKKWRANNPEHDYNRWRDSEEYRQINRKAKKRWRVRNPAAQQQARQDIRDRTPTWANPDAINAVYLLRDTLTKDTGIPHQVDHIIPLHGDKISGLHVENNLQVLTATGNRSKYNYWNDL